MSSPERKFHDHAEGTTPDTEEVRKRWMHCWEGYTKQEGVAAFERWFHQVRRDAYNLGYVQGYADGGEVVTGDDW